MLPQKKRPVEESREKQASALDRVLTKTASDKDDDSKVSMSKHKFVKEHKHLSKVLRSKDHKDDLAEAKKQEDELKKKAAMPTKKENDKGSGEDDAGTEAQAQLLGKKASLAKEASLAGR